MANKRYRIQPFPRARQFSIDAGRLGSKRHIVHGLFEADVTEAKRRMQEHEGETGENLSFTAFIIHCLGKAVESHDHLHAYLNWRRQLVIYEEVNVNTMVEVEMGGRKVPMPHILKAVNKRSYRAIHEEIREVQS
ncbi:MAG: dehydrogenase, partial [Anaerolineae bacterium]|nr:dehydrogenase [Anaerolineae bacterium]NIN97844.1 dehydrogenase [Anaerolineae bacterium]